MCDCWSPRLPVCGFPSRLYLTCPLIHTLACGMVRADDQGPRPTQVEQPIEGQTTAWQHFSMNNLYLTRVFWVPSFTEPCCGQAMRKPCKAQASLQLQDALIKLREVAEQQRGWGCPAGWRTEEVGAAHGKCCVRSECSSLGILWTLARPRRDAWA